jgi:hypothetical protein
MTDDSIGVDISKDFLDAHRLRDGTNARFQNSPAGFHNLSTWLGDDMPTRVVFEATGAYHRSLERTISGKIPLVKVNPLQARRFAQACGTRAKIAEMFGFPVGTMLSLPGGLFELGLSLWLIIKGFNLPKPTVSADVDLGNTISA